MREEELFDLAAEYGLDPEIVARIVAVLRPEPSQADPGEAQGASTPSPGPLRRTGLLGRGGMAEVWQAHDERLDRSVAMKVLLPELAAHPAARDRFVREARATARLSHPGIVPVHEVGTLPDGRPYFTMEIVRGRTLASVVAGAGTGPGPLRRLVEVFRRAVDAVAYAHQQGVLHRDLKPTNVMVGPFGTVFVLDWGLVRSTPGVEGADGPGLTRSGVIQGTPGYLSPEQARGETASPASDVFSLGLVLYELLHGRPAFDRSQPWAAVTAAAAGRVPACVAGPDVLRAVVARAVAARPEDRYPDAGALAEAVGHWLDGEARRVQAQALVDEAAALGIEQQRAAARADELVAEAEALLRAVPGHAPAEDKVAGWARQDEAGRLGGVARDLELRRLQTLHGALTHDADHQGALTALADHWFGVHRAAEARRDEGAAREARAQLAYYDRGAHATYLEGRGRLTLRTEPEGVPAVLYRLVEQDRRRIPVDPRPLGPTPVVVEGLEMGSWLVRLEGFPHVVVPAWIRRGTDWDVTVALPRPAGPDDCFVPGGPFWAGEPGAGFQSLPWGEVQVEPFLIRRHPVTHREYLAFLDDLVDRGREDDALRVAPRERGARPEKPGVQCYGRDDAGHFVLAPDADGDLWDPDWPVFLVDHDGACAYADWLAQRTGQPWRLPTEREWEKAARGVDGRAYPWGDRFDPSFACVRASHPGRPTPASVHAFPDDRSVYGVRGMAGNQRDWCSDPFHLVGAHDAPPGAQKVLKGGCWYFPESGAHLAARYALDASNRGDTVSFRVARDLRPEDLVRRG